ncbi:MAG TPA: penicillin-binding protein 2, partial [Polyangiaceae bacterium]
MKNLDPKRARWIRTRMGVLCGVMGLALGGIVSSAWRVQVEDGPEWREMAEKQRQRRLHVEPKRGTIYDRNGTPLAVSVEVPSVSADVVEMLRGADTPQAQEAILRDAALRLGRALSMDANEVYAKLAERHRFVWVSRRITGDEAEAIRELGDPKKQAQPIRGLSIEGEGHRSYPGRELAGAVLGFVAPDGQGKDGLELALDEDLRGRVEDVRGLRDRSGRLLFQGANDARALQGYDVTLSIDEGIQHVAERELDAAMHTYETKGGSLVVVDPSTGEILALASVPGYNPNDYGESDPDARRDRAVTDRFEPGSVMKTFMMAGALAAGTLKPTDVIDCERGFYRIDGATVHDVEVNDKLTPTQILARSSNIGALKIGLQLGEPALYATYRRFGFGEATGLPVPGEASGVLRPKGRPWYELETAEASFGQGVSVTIVKLAMA